MRANDLPNEGEPPTKVEPSLPQVGVEASRLRLRKRATWRRQNQNKDEEGGGKEERRRG